MRQDPAWTEDGSNAEEDVRESKVTEVDVLAGLTRAVRAEEAQFATSFLTPPWGLRFLDRPPLAIEVVVRGHAFLRPDDGGAVHLAAGDIGVVNGGVPYELADAVDTPPGAVVYGHRRAAASGEPERMAGDRWRLPMPRAYGQSADAPTVVVRGAYRSHSAAGRRLLQSLPAIGRVPASRLPRSLQHLLEEEVTREDSPGHQGVLDRLLDLLFVLALRAWLQEPHLQLPGWCHALTRPGLGPALQAIHDQPERRWTVADLARLAGMSRAAFADQFHAVVGQPPIAYLTAWRIELAASLLRDTDATLASIARTVGYTDGYALSTAFKRVTGATPASTRRRNAVVISAGNLDDRGHL